MLSFAVFGWIFLPLVMAAISATAAYFVRQHMLDTRWYAAIERAGGVAYQTFAMAGKLITDKSSLAAAAMAGAEYIQAQMTEQVARRGLTVEAIEQIVSAELGKLFAKDPSISVGTLSSVTATASPGQEATATVSDVPGLDIPSITAMRLSR